MWDVITHPYRLKLGMDELSQPTVLRECNYWFSYPFSQKGYKLAAL